MWFILFSKSLDCIFFFSVSFTLHNERYDLLYTTKIEYDLLYCIIDSIVSFTLLYNLLYFIVYFTYNLIYYIIYSSL